MISYSQKKDKYSECSWRAYSKRKGKEWKGSNHHKTVFQTVGRDREGMSVYEAVIFDGEMAHRLSVAESGEGSNGHDAPTILWDARSRR